MIIAKKNAAYYLSFPAIDESSPGSYKTGLTITDTAYYKDGAGAWTSLAIADAASEIGSTGVYEIDLTASEMNHDKVFIKFTATGMADDGVMLDLRTKLTDDLQDVSAADVNAQCDTAISDAALATAANLATVDTNVDAVLVDTGTTLPGLLTTIDTVVDAIKAVTDLLPDAGALNDLAAILTDTGTTIPAQITALNNISAADVNAQCDTAISDAALATAANLATVDTVVDAIKAKTDSLTFTVANQVDSNIQYVNDTLVTGTGAVGDEWGS